MIFRGDWWFLSNFYPSVIEWQGRKFATAEHLYQAMKCSDPAEVLLIRTAATPGQAKRLGRRAISVVPDWHARRVDVMRDVVWEKFKQNKPLGRKLVATGDLELVEDNTWGDTFWGRCKGVGQNKLGEILMEVRDGLREQQ